MTQRPNTKWPKFIAQLQADPGQWHHVAESVGPSTIQRLRALGAEVQTDSVGPRTGGATYSRYTVWARWPTPQTELERVTLQLANLTTLIEETRQDVQAADEEYASAKRILNRNAYRRKAAREKFEPLLEQHDQLTAYLNRLKAGNAHADQLKTEKD